MKKTIILITASIAFCNTTPNEISKDLIQTLGKNLKHELKKGGINKALKFCALNAYNITTKIQAKYPNATIKRISLKPRSPLDKPNKEETIILQTFEKLKKLKLKPKNLVIEKENKKVIYKPLYISKKVCLKCHGNIEPNSKISQTLKQYYPNDKATGYKLGDFRGAVVITLEKK
jgi:hypothetical protein